MTTENRKDKLPLSTTTNLIHLLNEQRQNDRDSGKKEETNRVYPSDNLLLLKR